MQSIESFIQGFLTAKIDEERRIQNDRMPYRKKFFDVNCLWDSRAGNIEMLESERVVHAEEMRPVAKAITEYKISSKKAEDQKYRRRYHLKLAGDSWLIENVENECPACHGQGNEDCVYCKGKHWVNSQTRK